MSLGATLANIGGTKMTWDTDTKHADTQALDIRTGFAYTQPIGFIQSTVTGAYSTSSAGSRWGVEYGFLDRVFLRVGSDMVSENGLAYGSGVSWMGVKLDYAYQSHTLGASHRVSLHISQ